MPRTSGLVRETWYGSFALDEDSAGLWTVGPFTLWALRAASEWRLATRRESEASNEISAVEIPAPGEDPAANSELNRYGFSTSPAEISLLPLLGDRPVVFSAESPLLLPSQEEMTLYVSTPAWIEVTLGDPPVTVMEQPLQRPTDTWFGPSTMRGELCYAVRTSARLRLERLPVRPHRVFSMVHIVNRAETHLSFARVKIPVPQMSVYGTADGRLWTEKVTLERDQNEGGATVHLGSGPPPQAADATLIHGPRTVGERGLLTSAFSGLIPWR